MLPVFCLFVYDFLCYAKAYKSDFALGGKPKNILVLYMSEIVLPIFSLGVLWCDVLHLSLSQFEFICVSMCCDGVF